MTLFARAGTYTIHVAESELTSLTFGELVEKELAAPFNAAKEALRRSLGSVEEWDHDRRAVLQELYENMVVPIEYEPCDAQFYRVLEGSNERVRVYYQAVSDLMASVLEICEPHAAGRSGS